MLYHPPGVVYLETPVRKTPGSVEGSGCGVPGAFFWLPARVCMNDGEDLGVNPTGRRKAPGEKHGHWIFRV
jgi:hypothetical protein